MLDQCFDAGVGSTVEISLGGKADPILGKADALSSLEAVALHTASYIAAAMSNHHGHRWRSDRGYCDGAGPH